MHRNTAIKISELLLQAKNGFVYPRKFHLKNCNLCQNSLLNIACPLSCPIYLK